MEFTESGNVEAVSPRYGAFLVGGWVGREKGLITDFKNSILLAWEDSGRVGKKPVGGRNNWPPRLGGQSGFTAGKLSDRAEVYPPSPIFSQTLLWVWSNASSIL